MSEFKATKGKWVMEDYEHCIAIETLLDNGQKHALFTDQFCYASKFNGDAKANALLISKAPEMLDMLKGIVIRFEDNERLSMMEISILNDAKQLIKEATQL